MGYIIVMTVVLIANIRCYTHGGQHWWNMFAIGFILCGLITAILNELK